MKAVLSSLVAGFVFAVGLGVGGMTDPVRVQGFLDVTGNWDPSLAFVMAGALTTHALMRWFILKRRAPVFEPAFPAATHARVDLRLLFGSALFGAGWGLSGFCPGPALTSVASGGGTALTFVLAMLAGMGVFQVWETARGRPSVAVSAAATREGPARAGQ